VLVGSNGTFLEVTRPWLRAVLRLGELPPTPPLPYGEVREGIEFSFGVIPIRLLEEFLAHGRACLPSEVAGALIHSSGSNTLRLQVHDAIEAGPSGVRYRMPDLAPGESLAVDLHTHGRLQAFWSSTDDADDQGVKVCGVFGSLHQVRRTPEEALFNSLLQQHHYLGYTQPVGEHLKYLVYAQGRPIACVAWCSAPRHLGSRDRHIGWSAHARLANIRLLAYNTRFLILPWVTVPHLASNILGRMARMLSADWQDLYGHPIYFVETFVDPQRFRGTCYRAANWTLLGQTTGRGKDAPTRQANRSIKQVLGLALVKDFRQRLSHVAA
jgi:PRTRC genetic system protein A